jgi:2-polyprenyl-6-methoxyphenol hydroxylase-like FAD-dependent oxidoreductase
MANTRIGVIGAGPGGLHLGLFLQKHGVTSTLYSERKPDEIRKSKLPNTAIHWWNVRKRDAELGVDHWEEEGQLGNSFWVGLPQPLVFKGHFKEKSLIVDNRLYCATLLEDYIKRGGDVAYGPVKAEDLVKLSEKHELVVVATGRGNLTELFPRVPEYSLTEPRRRLCTGIYKGVTNPQPEYLGVNFVPGVGEFYEMPYLTFDGKHTAFFIFVVPGGPWEVVMGVRYEDNPQKFNETILGVVSKHFPHIRERINEKAFGLRSALDYLQGAITPTVRRAYTKLANGKYVVAIGDLHSTHDPIMGQGVGCATNGAFVVGEAILEDGLAFDERFCQVVEERIWSWTRDAFLWTNYMMLVPYAANTADVIIAASKNQVLADALCDNFAAPSKNWNALATLERSRNLLRVLGMESPLIDQALASK